MQWWLRLILLSVGLAGGSLACAPKPVGPTALGYYVAIRVSAPAIFLPEAAEVLVRVQDSQGRPVDGVSVAFQVEPGWVQYASLTPPQALTQGGIARAVFRAQTIGVARVIVRVDTVSQEAQITISPRPSPPSGV
jgi:hypothetical protein